MNTCLCVARKRERLTYIKKFIELKQLTVNKVAAKVNLVELLTKFVKTTQFQEVIKYFVLRLPSTEQNNAENTE